MVSAFRRSPRWAVVILLLLPSTSPPLKCLRNAEFGFRGGQNRRHRKALTVGLVMIAMHLNRRPALKRLSRICGMTAAGSRKVLAALPVSIAVFARVLSWSAHQCAAETKDRKMLPRAINQYRSVSS
ncbi:hypothetical protein KCP78_22470 [Salmonella enterica subsp. enterica]|nr:hypothetical protein KCP78_22470 [Salmonella enterica subsp. enterica]